MIKKLSIAFLLLCTGVVSIAQNNDYYNLKEVKNYRFDHLVLDQERDIHQFLQNPSDYNFIEALKIGNTARLEEILSYSQICKSVKELNLIDYSGDFRATTFDSCMGIEVLHIRLKENKLNQLSYLKPLNNLQALYLYIDGHPEDLSSLNLLPILRELHIIGEFLPDKLEQLALHIKKQTFLQVLSLSIDRITDLPEAFTKFKTLNKINLYDNLSVYVNKGIDDLSEEKLSIIFNIYSDMINAISVSYFSNNGKLADFEIDYLQKLYKGELLPQQFEMEENSANTEGQIPFQKEFTPDFIPTQEFNRPYPKISPEIEYFTINPQQNCILFSNSGMKISIAAKSFENSLGETILDPVYLSLMQISTPTDLLFSGINLKNGSRQFCSQFMFNIKASTEKSTAQLKSGYQIKVAMPVSLDSNLTYFFDYESNTWQDLNLYNQVFATNFTPIDFYKIDNSSFTQAYYQFDTSRFDNRFNSRHHYFLNDYKNNSQMLFRKSHFFTDLDRPWTSNYNKDGKLKGLKIKRGKSYVKVQRVIPKVRNRERIYFKLLDKTEQQIIKELCAFKKINFNVPVNHENRREFNDNYVKNAKYFDVKVHYKEGKDYCEITLKTVDGFKILKAFITDSENKKTIKKHLSQFNKAYKKYVHLQARRKNEFNLLNTERYNEFQVYSNDRIKELQKSNLYTEIKIPSLGSFSLMKDLSPDFSTNIIAQYTDASGIPIDVKGLYMIDTRYNTVFNIEVGNIAFYPRYISCIIATDYSGNLYYANRSDISTPNLSDNSLIYIKLKKLNPGVSTIQAFNHLLRH